MHRATGLGGEGFSGFLIPLRHLWVMGQGYWRPARKGWKLPAPEAEAVQCGGQVLGLSLCKGQVARGQNFGWG